MGEKLLNSVEDISVVDVYDLASDIGKECEKIIDAYGADTMKSLMPKVVNALELLEALANRNESENSTLEMLTDQITLLENEKHEKALLRERLQKELEAVEEQWHNETNELAALVSRLQEENRRMTKEANSPRHESKSTKDNQMENPMNPSDFQLLQRLRAQLEKQRDELMCRDQEIQEKNNEIENLTIQLERLRTSSQDLRKRQKILHTQVRSLWDERTDSLVQIQNKNREIDTLRQKAGISDGNQSEKCDANIDENRPFYTVNELKELLRERDALREKIQTLEYESNVNESTLTAAAAAMRPEEDEEPIATGEEISESSEPIEEDPPVQGPLPFEPEDAPWKKTTESGVRKFFRKLFSESRSSSLPRRSLSTVTKMAKSVSPSRNSAI